MNRMRRDVGRALGAATALRLLVGGSLHTNGAVVFAYHDVGPEASKADFFVTDQMLREQLSAARDWGLEFVDLATLVDALLTGERVDGLTAVTFDDALLGVREHALPVLAELGITATVFVVADALGRDPSWYPESERVLTADELRDVVAAGHRIGSHTLTHASLPAIDDAVLRSELAGSREKLSDLTSVDVDLLAYPHGHHDPRVRNVAAQAGYRAGFTFFNGRVTDGLDPFKLPRLTMSATHTRSRLAYHLARPSWSWPDHQVDVPGHQPGTVAR
jgi:peptidoglycan/xylan/chitin deacetylase (PgdA/CDA1 family)